ncbi:MAG: hypothetical protein FWD13_10950 [Treponema sp.]|nr:hypothetical protein [Treponema sp.]
MVVIQTLIKNNDISEEKAVDFYFSSNTYKQLSDETTGLLNKSWKEIYDLIKLELNIL